MSPSRRCPGRPTAVVVFVDLGMMLSFDQLASRLRAHRVRTVHLTVSSNPLARLVSRAAYDQTVHWAVPGDLAPVLRSLDVERVADVQCPEALLGDVLAAARDAGLPAAVVRRLEQRREWMDKHAVARRLAAAGLPAPRVAPLAGHTADELAGLLGLPLVVKAAVGSGGEGVTIAHTADDVAAAVARLGVLADTAYAEQFLPGHTLCWAGVVAGGEVVDAVVYRTIQGRQAEGPSSSIKVVDDPEVMRIGARVAALVGTNGMLNLDLVRDAGRRPQVVDVNVRAWHSVVALDAVGHDFTRAWLASLGLAVAGPGGGRTGVVHVFPDQGGSARAVSRTRGAGRFVRDLVGQRHVLPLRYLAVQCVVGLRHLLDGPRGGVRGQARP